MTRLFADTITRSIEQQDEPNIRRDIIQDIAVRRNHSPTFPARLHPVTINFVIFKGTTTLIQEDLCIHISHFDGRDGLRF